MYTISHMWVANMDGIIPEGRSKVYGLYKTMDEALAGLDKWFKEIPNNGCEITRVTETSFKIGLAEIHYVFSIVNECEYK